jgi:hypothetical protein
LFLLRSASIQALKFEEIPKRKNAKRSVVGGRPPVIEGKIMNLSIETKVAIAVATSFVLLMVGAMAQG